MNTIPDFSDTKSTPGYMYVVEYNGAGYAFDERKEALLFADENNCLLVEGVKI